MGTAVRCAVSQQTEKLLGRVTERQRERRLVALSAFLTFAGMHFALGLLLEIVAPGMFHKWLVDSLCTAAVGALLVWIILRVSANQRKVIREELRRVAELNHNVRNALQVIAAAQHFEHLDEQHAAVNASVSRIDETLHRLFPVVDQRQTSRPLSRKTDRRHSDGVHIVPAASLKGVTGQLERRPPTPERERHPGADMDFPGSA